MQLVEQAMALKPFKLDAVLNRLGNRVGIDLRQQRRQRGVSGEVLMARTVSASSRRRSHPAGRVAGPGGVPASQALRASRCISVINCACISTR